MKIDFSFLKSVRFWKLFIVAVAEFIAAQGIIDLSLAHALAIWLGGSVVVRTVDRSAEVRAIASLSEGK